jgi:hypothetical protein
MSASAFRGTVKAHAGTGLVGTHSMFGFYTTFFEMVKRPFNLVDKSDAHIAVVAFLWLGLHAACPVCSSSPRDRQPGGTLVAKIQRQPLANKCLKCNLLDHHMRKCFEMAKLKAHLSLSSQQSNSNYIVRL